MTVEFRLNGFNASHIKCFYKVLNWYGLTYDKRTDDNNIRIIKFDRDFESSMQFINFCKEISKKYRERKLQNGWTYDVCSVDVAINTITQPYLAVFTLHIKKARN